MYGSISGFSITSHGSIPHNLDFGALSFEFSQSVGHKVSKQKLIFQNTECNDATKQSDLKYMSFSVAPKIQNT